MIVFKTFGVLYSVNALNLVSNRQLRTHENSEGVSGYGLLTDFLKNLKFAVQLLAVEDSRQTLPLLQSSDVKNSKQCISDFT